MKLNFPILAFILSILFSWIIIKTCNRYGWVEKPRYDRWHLTPVAKYGGVAIFFSFLISILLNQQFSSLNVLLIVGGLFSFVLGFFDDFRSIHPRVKLVSHIALAITAFLIGFKFLPSAPIFISLPLTIFWIVGIINAFNLLDNMDGLSSGIAIITSTIIGIGAYLHNDLFIFNISLIVTGSCLGFLFFNFKPAKIFMGDSGSIFLGFVLSILTLSATNSNSSNIAIALVVPVAVMAIPIFDTALVTINRIFHKRPITSGGKDHSSHRLVRLGFSERKAVVFLYAISALMGATALIFQLMDVLFWSSIAVLLILSMFVFGLFLSNIKVYSGDSYILSPDKISKSNNFIWNVIIMYKKQIIEIVIDIFIIVASYSLSYYLRFESSMTSAMWDVYTKTLPAILLIKLITFNLCKVYSGVWRYIGIPDLLKILKASIIGTIISIVYVTVVYRFEGFSRSVFIIDFILTFLFIAGFRLFFRLFSDLIVSGASKENKKNILIIGAGDAGNLVLREIKNNNKYNFNIVGFIDDNPTKKGLSILNVPVLGGQDKMEEIIAKNEINEVIVSIFNATEEQLKKIYSNCDQLNIPYKKTILNFKNGSAN